MAHSAVKDFWTGRVELRPPHQQEVAVYVPEDIEVSTILGNKRPRLCNILAPFIFTGW
jgi:hypothetical protein